MKNKIAIGGTVMMLAAKSVWGAETINNDAGMHYEHGNYYRAHEFSVDGFGTASLGEYSLDHLSGDKVQHNIRLGAGAGINYFFTRNLGLGLDAYSENITGAFVDSASAKLLLRLPLGESGFAPYAFGGGGRQFDLLKAWFAQIGAGIEYRFCPKLGVFLDARWVLPDEAKYYGFARLGMRFIF